jgi:broad specificity phosphatase PhoE
MIKNLYFLRHGATDWNKENKKLGRVDKPLNETGITQAKNAIPNIKKLNIDLVMTSPLKRAYKTAEILTSALDLNLKISDKLKERNYGDVEGMTLDDVKTKFPTLDAVDRDPTHPDFMNICFPNGETKQELLNRVAPEIKRISEIPETKNILIVTHKSVIRTFIYEISREYLKEIKNTEIVSFKFDTVKQKFFK